MVVVSYFSLRDSCSCAANRHRWCTTPAGPARIGGLKCSVNSRSLMHIPVPLTSLQTAFVAVVIILLPLIGTGTATSGSPVSRTASSISAISRRSSAPARTTSLSVGWLTYGPSNARANARRDAPQREDAGYIRSPSLALAGRCRRGGVRSIATTRRRTCEDEALLGAGIPAFCPHLGCSRAGSKGRDPGGPWGRRRTFDTGWSVYNIAGHASSPRHCPGDRCRARADGNPVDAPHACRRVPARTPRENVAWGTIARGAFAKRRSRRVPNWREGAESSATRRFPQRARARWRSAPRPSRMSSLEPWWLHPCNGAM